MEAEQKIGIHPLAAGAAGAMSGTKVIADIVL